MIKGKKSPLYALSRKVKTVPPTGVVSRLKFRKKSEKPVLKGAFIEEAIYVGDDQLEILTALKSKEELIGDIITLLQSPAKNVVSALQSGSGKLAGIVQTLAER